MGNGNTVIIEGKMGGTYERTVQGGNQEAGRPVRKRTGFVADLAIRRGAGQGRIKRRSGANALLLFCYVGVSVESGWGAEEASSWEEIFFSWAEISSCFRPASY